MAGHALIIVLAAALVLAVGVLLFGVGRMAFGIGRYYLRERHASREVEHPTFRLLTGEGGIWSGTTRIDGREIHFAVPGSDSAPDEQLLRRVVEIVGRFADVERRGAGQLRKQEAETRNAPLEVYGLEVTDGTGPDDFTLEFLADGDDSWVWRVAFQGGEPRLTGFDD